MSRGFKVFLIVLGVLTALLVAIGVGGYLWFRANKDRLVAMGKSAHAEGDAFGRGRASPACESEALVRADACTGLFCEVGVKLFLEACLRAATQPLGYCEGVPAPSAILDSARFALGRCQAAGRPNDQRCGRIVQAIQKHCHGER